jgi:hypothetical protein
MPRTRDKTVEAYADATHKLIQRYVADPSAEEIAAEFMPGTVVPPAIIADVRRRLRRIRDVMVADEPFRCAELHLVNATYYRRHRDDGASIGPNEARLCLPIGAGNIAEGLRITQVTDDAIWLAAVALWFNQGAGQTRKSQTKLIGTFDRGLLSEDRARQELQRAAGYIALPEQIAAKTRQLMPPGVMAPSTDGGAT